jgi:hypothetical protein
MRNHLDEIQAMVGGIAVPNKKIKILEKMSCDLLISVNARIDAA